MPSMRADVGETVLKNGITTGLTFGTVLDPVLIEWEYPTAPTIADQRKLKCDAVLGEEMARLVCKVGTHLQMRVIQFPLYYGL